MNELACFLFFKAVHISNFEWKSFSFLMFCLAIHLLDKQFKLGFASRHRDACALETKYHLFSLALCFVLTSYIIFFS